MTLLKLAIPFILNNELNDQVAEFNITFDKNKNSVEKLLDFIDKYKDHRINISFAGSFPIGVISAVHKVSNNTYIRLTTEHFPYCEQLKEEGYRFFFDSSYPAYNLATLDCLIEVGVTDIYPSDDLLYNLKETKAYCDSHNVGMRLVLNSIPATTFDRGTNYKSQIYRPQDRKFLDEYFTVYEFACGRPYDWAKFDVLYRAWFVREGWNGDLSEINDDLELPFPNLQVLLDLTMEKAKCGRKCNQRNNAICNKCSSYITLAQDLVDKGVYLRENKQRKLRIGQN